MTMTACARAARVVLAAIVFASFPLLEASAAEYRFVRIADTADGGFFLDPSRHAAINNAGDVALYKSLPGFTAGYFSGNGGALSTIATTEGGPLAGLALHRPSFNDS